MAPRVLISDALSDASVQIFKDRGVDVEFQPKLEAVVRTCLVFDLDFDLERFAFGLFRHRHFEHAVLVGSLDSILAGVLGHRKRSAHRAIAPLRQMYFRVL